MQSAKDKLSLVVGSVLSMAEIANVTIAAS